MTNIFSRTGWLFLISILYKSIALSLSISFKDYIPAEEGKSIYLGAKPRQPLIAEAPHVAYVAEQGTCLVSSSINSPSNHITGPLT